MKTHSFNSFGGNTSTTDSDYQYHTDYGRGPDFSPLRRGEILFFLSFRLRLFLATTTISIIFDYDGDLTTISFNDYSLFLTTILD